MKIKQQFKRAFKRFSTVSEQKRFNPFVLAIFALIIGGGGLIIIFSRAAPAPPTIYLTPTSTTIGPSGTFSVQVRENSGTTGVNAVQANFSYSSSLVSCTSIDTSTSAFGVQAQSTCSAGQVTIARGVTGGGAPLTGDQLIAVVNFSASTTSGAAAMAFTSGTALVDATNNQDLLGSLAATAGGTYTVDATGPTTTVTAPANNATLAYGNNITITATATDTSAISNVQIYVDGTLKTTLNSSPYTYTWSGATLGAHTIQARATDAFNNLGTSSTINVTVADQSAPAVSITAPSSSAILSGSSVTATATASDNVGVSSVQFQLDGTNLGALLTTSPYSITWNTTTASNGSHSLTALAKDAANNTTTSSSVVVTVDNGAPSASIATPIASATVTGTTSVTTTVADNVGGSGIAKVELYVDGTLQATSTTSPYTFSWNTTTATFGAHTLTIKAYDKASPANITTSAGVSVNVNNAPPGDVNADGHVTIIDLSILLSNYATTTSTCDLNNDGTVNIFDLSILLSHYGQ